MAAFVEIRELENLVPLHSCRIRTCMAILSSRTDYICTIHELLCTTVIRAQGTAPPVLPPPRRRLWPYIAKGFDEHLLPLVML